MKPRIFIAAAPIPMVEVRPTAPLVLALLSALGSLLSIALDSPLRRRVVIL